MPKDPNEIGALWIKESKNGTVFYSGRIEGVGDVVVFEITRKTKDNQPDFRVLKSRPRE